MGNICGTQNVESKQTCFQHSSPQEPLEVQGKVKVGIETNISLVKQISEAETIAEANLEANMEIAGPAEVAAEELKEEPKQEQKEGEDQAEGKVEAFNERAEAAGNVAKEIKEEPKQEPKEHTEKEQTKISLAKSEPASSTTSTGPAEYLVVGGGEKGGIMVRKGKRTSSKELPRLMLGARIQEIERCGDRIHFEKTDGQGPKTGWVSAAVNGKNLLERM